MAEAFWLVTVLYTFVRIVLALVSRREKKKSGKRRRRALERNEISVDRTIPGPCERHGLAGSANCAFERADQLSDIASQVPREGPCLTARLDHDGEQAAAFAGLS